MKLSLIFFPAACAICAFVACSSGVMESPDAAAEDATTDVITIDVAMNDHNVTKDAQVLDSGIDVGDAAADAAADSPEDAPDGDGYSPPCVPVTTLDGGPVRAALDNLASSTTTGCASGNPCQQNSYDFKFTYEQNFADAGEQIVCSGVSTCISNVGIDTFNGSTICQGSWDVYCDSAMVGTLDTTMAAHCAGSPMTNGCSISFPPITCSSVTLVAETGSGDTCCGKGNVDSMIVAVSAW
jgi:hypothetical protein